MGTFNVLLRRRPLVALCTLCAAAIVLPACGGGGGDAEDDTSDVVVLSFQLVDRDLSPTGGSGTTNAYRNNRLLFEFTSEIDPDTVSDRTIQIGIPSGGNLFLTLDGKFTVDGRRVIFDPTETSAGAPQPFGFDADADYSVTVNGHPNDKTLRDVDGKPVREEFRTTFRTTDLFLPDRDQPRVVSVTPEANATDVGSSADVVVEFSEAMKPGSVDLETSFRILNGNTGREVLGQILFSDDATRVTFRPTFGYGKGPTVVTVTLTVDLTDLAGNPISNPRQQTFTTVFDPFAPDEGIIEEFFDDDANKDGEFVPPDGAAHAEWAVPGSEGQLKSVFGQSKTTFPGARNRPNVGNYIPMGGSAWASCRWQGWYKPSELGQAGTISGMDWISSPVGVGAGATVTNFELWLGHNNTPTGLQGTAPFTTNLNVGSPTTCIPQTTYTQPSTVTPGGVVPFPAFTNMFGYDGTNNLVIDLRKTNVSVARNLSDLINAFDNNTRRAYSQTSTGGANATSPVGSSVGLPWRLVAHFRTEASAARSIWFDTDTADPIYLEAIINPTLQPAGTEVEVEFEGALPDEDGQRSENPADWSAPSTDIEDMDGYPFIRFTVTFKANVSTGVGPSLTEILIPFIDR